MNKTNFNTVKQRNEIFMAALMSENFCELYDIISNILSGFKLNRFMESVINMSEEWVSLHEWAKEAMDELVDEVTREELRKEVAEEVKKK